MLRLMTFLTALLWSCSAFVPEPGEEVLPVWNREASQICEAELCPPAENTAQALLIVDQEWRERFPEQQCEILQRLTVHWHEDDECSRGCTGEGDRVNPSHIHVYHGVDFVAGSSMVHETEHPCSKEQFQTSDPDHEQAGLWDDPDNDAQSIERDAQNEIIRAGL